MDGNTQTEDVIQTEPTQQSNDGTPKTYTEEEAKQLANEQASKAGFKRIAELEAKHKEEIDALKRKIEEREEAEEFAKIDQTDEKAKSNWQLKQELKKANERIKVAEEKATKADEYERKEQTRSNAKEIASKYEDNISEQLINLTDGSKEKMEELAKIIGKPKVPSGSIIPDPGNTSGGVMSDKAFIEGIGNGTIPLTKENMERANKLGLGRR